MVDPTQPGAPVLLEVDFADGRPSRARAVWRVDATPERVWAVVSNIDAYPNRVPMIHAVRRQGNRVAVALAFKMAFFSTKFRFEAEVTEEPGRSIQLRGISGEPSGVFIRIEIEPLDGGRATLLRGEQAFEVHSLGWIVRSFLKFHPEIEYGILPGSTMALVDAMRRGALPL